MVVASLRHTQSLESRAKRDLRQSAWLPDAVRAIALTSEEENRRDDTNTKADTGVDDQVGHLIRESAKAQSPFTSRTTDGLACPEMSQWSSNSRSCQTAAVSFHF